MVCVCEGMPLTCIHCGPYFCVSCHLLCRDLAPGRRRRRRRRRRRPPFHDPRGRSVQMSHARQGGSSHPPARVRWSQGHWALPKEVFHGIPTFRERFRKCVEKFCKEAKGASRQTPFVSACPLHRSSPNVTQSLMSCDDGIISEDQNYCI